MSNANSEPLSDHARRAAATYSAAADHYGRDALGFWDKFGEGTVARLQLADGQRVLDLCCGAGASAIPAARAVGMHGRVLGLDLAAPLLDMARARAASECLVNIEFRQADATNTGLADFSFDAVICVFGVFFAADMTSFMTEMWGLVRPGGVLAITTWGPGWCEPASTAFWTAVGQIEPSLFKAFNPWDEITTPAALTDLFIRAGTASPTVIAVPGQHEIGHPDQFWDVVLGSGYRATIDAMTAEQQYRARDQVLRELRAANVTILRTDVVFGTAVRPS